MNSFRQKCLDIRAVEFRDAEIDEDGIPILDLRTAKPRPAPSASKNVGE